MALRCAVACCADVSAVTTGLIVPLLPFGMPKYDAGERFDLRSPYSDDGWVVSESLGGLARQTGPDVFTAVLASMPSSQGA